MINTYINICYIPFIKHLSSLAKENFEQIILENIKVSDFIDIVKFYNTNVDVFDIFDIQPPEYSDITSFKRWCYNKYFEKFNNQDEVLKQWQLSFTAKEV